MNIFDTKIKRSKNLAPLEYGGRLVSKLNYATIGLFGRYSCVNWVWLCCIFGVWLCYLGGVAVLF